ncbi:FNTA [Symbiodinium necroappetens]|uniref:Protein farnesyltransferase/geranylgeranyltransferase type-1 subunit alpha n=1 Tax=Symbiodinium necroappetens TaxID=1628268 RepID=A0A813B8E9_9DINO|nr:FNTA [Symbiodinium necroappetens]
MPCNSACSALNSEGNIFQCGKEEMAAINTSAAILTLVSDLNLTVACSPTEPRNDGGSPFTTPGGGCYYWNSGQPAGNVDCDSVLNGNRIPLCYCVPGPPAPIPDPSGPWLAGVAFQPCSHTCQKEGFANCGKEEMAAINSSAALFTLTSHLNLTCNPPTGSPFRDGGGSPFTTTSGSCYYWDPSKPAEEVNCDTVLNSGRQPMCYCVPGPPAPIPGPPENWISAAANQPCNTACSNAGFDECGQEEMAAINSTATLSTLLSLLNLTCTPPATGSPFRDGGGSLRSQRQSFANNRKAEPELRLHMLCRFLCRVVTFDLRSSQIVEMEAENLEDELPYSQRESWKDISPIPQNDGPHPLAVIKYPLGFEEVHNYFRAIQQRNETSERALHLTADVIEHNSANYTAWYYRRRCLKDLGIDLEDERVFTDKWARDCPKNYQVWYHRRWLVSEMAARARSHTPGPEAEATIQQIAKTELDYHLECMRVNSDYKNYNGWSHRQYILQQFNMWHEELPFVELLLEEDIRNNSAWNHRYTVVRNQSWPLTDSIRDRELAFAMQAIRKCASNECAWNYLSAFLGEGDGKVPWTSAPALEMLCREVIHAADNQGPSCCFAIQALANIHEARGEVQAALDQYERLKELDRIRAKYWCWRADYLKQKVKGIS